MPDGELDVTLSSLSLSSTAELSGNVLHATLANLSLLANGGVAITGALDRSLANLSSLGAGAVQISGALASTLSGVKTLVFGRVYKGIDSPYEDVASWTGHPLSGSRVRVRTGNLFGIFGEDGEFGIFAGDGWDSSSGAPPPVSSQYIRLGNIVNEFHNVPIKLYDEGNITMQMEPDAPSFAMGSPIPSGYDTGVGLWQGKDSDGTYKWRVGDPSGANLSWNGSSLLMNNASLDISGASVHIALGNPPPTAHDTGTGIWMDNTGIYGLNGGARQVYIDTATGIFYSGAGTVRIDEAGANIVIGTFDYYNHFTGVELNSTGLYGKVDDEVLFSLGIDGVPFLKIGSGTKDIDLTGIQIDDTEMVGQNNGVDQVVIGADGKLIAGAGDVLLDSDGITINTRTATTSPNRLKWKYAYDDSVKYYIESSGMDIWERHYNSSSTPSQYSQLRHYKFIENSTASITQNWLWLSRENGGNPDIPRSLAEDYISLNYNINEQRRKIKINRSDGVRERISLFETKLNDLSINPSTNKLSLFLQDDTYGDKEASILQEVKEGASGYSKMDLTAEKVNIISDLVVDGTIKDGNGVEYSKTTHSHDHGSLTGLADNDHPQYVLAANNKIYFAMSNTTWNFKPGNTNLFIVNSMSLSDVVIPQGHDLLVEFDAIGYFRDIYGANIYLYNGTTLMITFGAPMRMNIATARAGFHYSYRITSAGTYNLSIRCTANGSTSVDMDFLTRSLKATVIQE